MTLVRLRRHVYTHSTNSKPMSNPVIQVPPVQHPIKNELPKRLNLPLAQSLFQNAIRIRQLEEQAIATPQRDSELAALRKANAELVFRYQLDLLQVFLLYVNEFAPFMQALTPIVGRIMMSMQRPEEEVSEGGQDGNQTVG